MAVTTSTPMNAMTIQCSGSTCANSTHTPASSADCDQNMPRGAVWASTSHITGASTSTRKATSTTRCSPTPGSTATAIANTTAPRARPQRVVRRARRCERRQAPIAEAGVGVSEHPSMVVASDSRRARVSGPPRNIGGAAPTMSERPTSRGDRCSVTRCPSSAIPASRPAPVASPSVSPGRSLSPPTIGRVAFSRSGAGDDPVHRLWVLDLDGDRGTHANGWSPTLTISSATTPTRRRPAARGAGPARTSA